MTLLTSIQGDITKLSVDAVVNAANSRLAGGGGVDGAIHAAGGPVIAEQCRRWFDAHGPLPTGNAMATDAGDLPARVVIHTVGPVYREHDPEEAASLLGACYRNSLELAAETECASVAFPSISTGVYGYPKPPAAAVAVSSVREWAAEHDAIERVVFVCFRPEDASIYEDLLAPA